MLPAIKQELVLLASTFSVTFLVTVVIVSLNTIILPIQQGFFKIIYSKKDANGNFSVLWISQKGNGFH